MLKASLRQGKNLTELVSDLEMFPQELVNVRVNAGFDVLSDEKVKQEIRAVEAELGETGRVLIRKSGTEPLIRVMVEGQERGEVRQHAARLADCIRQQAEEA